MVLLMVGIGEQLGAKLLSNQLGPFGVAQFVSSKNAAGVGNMLNALVAFILIALGIYVGNALVLHVRSRRAVASVSSA
jgi:hypothetical protein